MNGQTITSTANGNITISPNGTGDVVLEADTIKIGDLNSTVYLDTNGTSGGMYIRSAGGDAASTTQIVLGSGANQNVAILPNGTGQVTIGTGTTTGKLSSFGAYGLVLQTNSGTNSGTITINSGSNQNISIVPNGTGKTAITNPLFTEYVYSGGNATGTITPDAVNGSVQKFTLTGSITLNAFANPVAGQSMTLILTQDGTGGRTLTSSMKWAGGAKTLSTAANSIDIATIFYDGTSYYASLSTAFA